MTRCLRAILVGGAIGGAGDLAFALANTLAHDKTPMFLLQLIASGAFGKAAFDGGVPMAAVGAAFHFALSWLWAGVYVAVSRRWPRMVAKPWLSTIAFGVCVFLAMRLVVLPLSAFPFPVSFKPLPSLLDLLSHVYLFALPIAWATRRWCR
jgi:uncharacterized membrane protein YagU involved in acid resistance